MKLIVNADDFGLTSGVTYGIYDAMCRGVVTSTSKEIVETLRFQRFLSFS